MRMVWKLSLWMAVGFVASAAQAPAGAGAPQSSSGTNAPQSTTPQSKTPGSPPQTSNAPPPGNPAIPQAGTAPATPDTGQVPPPPTDAPLTLQNAIERARAYNSQFMAAANAVASAREDRVQAKAALLPSLNELNQYIYTEGNGTPSGVFIANDGVHVYNELAVVHGEVFSITKNADYRRTRAAEAVARAKLDVAQRGLVATVVQNYFAIITSQRHLRNAQASLDDALRFLDISQKQEAGGEVAHADVVKAQLQVEQRRRDLMDAQVNAEKARMALGVMLFPNIDQAYSVADEMSAEAVLPPIEEVRAAAIARSPDVRAAQATVAESGFAVKVARGAYYPSLVFDYFYGIDANVFATRGPNDRQNLGYSALGTVTVPVWNWGATRSKVRQAQLQEQQAKTELMLARRSLQAGISSAYLEAQAARGQLDSLRASLQLSAESLRLTILRYQAGEATALEVSDAQSTLAQARNAYDDGLARYTVALVGIQTLTGKI